MFPFDDVIMSCRALTASNLSESQPASAERWSYFRNVSNLLVKLGLDWQIVALYERKFYPNHNFVDVIMWYDDLEFIYFKCNENARENTS